MVGIEYQELILYDDEDYLINLIRHREQYRISNRFNQLHKVDCRL